MLGNNPYYFRIIRKIVQSFGSLFNNMILIKYTTDTLIETQRLTVPLIYAGKENYITRLLDNPNLAKPVEITLPRASFEIVSYQYDSSRVLSRYNSITAPGVNNSILQQYQPVPYNIGFELSIYVRDVEDGLQLIEQILPVFNPTYTMTVNYLPQMGISRNLPVTINNVNCSTQYEGDAKSESRIIIWTLGFTVQAEIFGPINTGNVITSTNTNITISDVIGGVEGGLPGIIDLTLSNGGFGTYQINEFVYQGQSLATATATGVVDSYNNVGSQLILSNVQGVFVADNVNVIGATSNATWPVANTSPNILTVTIIDGITPANANVNSDFGFTTQIIEY